MFLFCDRILTPEELASVVYRAHNIVGGGFVSDRSGSPHRREYPFSTQSGVDGLDRALSAYAREKSCTAFFNTNVQIVFAQMRHSWHTNARQLTTVRVAGISLARNDVSDDAVRRMTEPAMPLDAESYRRHVGSKEVYAEPPGRTFLIQ
jgi:hypothetical protein